jgi:hypothetical protein
MSSSPFDRWFVLCVACSIAACEAGEAPTPELGVTRAALLGAGSCPPDMIVIVGDNNQNTLFGTASDDCILGYGGNDTIHGLGGDDVLIGGTGTDTLYGNDGDDTLYGEDHTDYLYGNAGNDTLRGGGSSDYIDGGDDDDTAYGDMGNDLIAGGLGNDTLFGSIGEDTIRGGDGDDRIFGEADADDLYGEAGNDIVDGGSSSDVIGGGTGDDVIQGGPNSDTLQGDDGNDAIIDVSGAANTVVGGAGTDRCKGTGCELAAPVATGCTADAQCPSPETCVIELGVCLPCLSDLDGDDSCDADDGCPSDPLKSTPGVCGCGVADTDTDGDATADCNDACSADPNKLAPGICGCGVADTDTDGDATADCNDACSADPNKLAPGICGCGVADTDTDGDATADCNDLCPGFDDALDADMDGVPDDCDSACVEDGTSGGSCPCVPGTTGPGIHDGDVIATGADAGTVLDAIEGLHCITGSLIITGSNLVDLPQLASLVEIGGELQINDNALLPPCHVGLLAQQIEGECVRLTASGSEPCSGNGGHDNCSFEAEDCVPGASGPGIYDGSFSLYTSDSDLGDLAGIYCITGDVYFVWSPVTDLSPMTSLKHVGGELRMTRNNQMTSLYGLHELETVGRQLVIWSNDKLESLAGLASLHRVGVTHPMNAVIDIKSNIRLPACWIPILEEQTSLTCNVCLQNNGTGTCD